MDEDDSICINQSSDFLDLTYKKNNVLLGLFRKMNSLRKMILNVVKLKKLKLVHYSLSSYMFRKNLHELPIRAFPRSNPQKVPIKLLLQTE